MRHAAVLLIAGLLAGGCAAAYNSQQWHAKKAFEVCTLAALHEEAKAAYAAGRSDPGQAYFSFDAAPDGTLYYTKLVNPAAEARRAECFRTKYPDLKIVEGRRPAAAATK